MANLKESGIEQLLRRLRNFHETFPIHHDKKAYGILAAVSVQEEVKQQVKDAGLYFAHIHDDLFDLEEDEGFEAKAF